MRAGDEEPSHPSSPLSEGDQMLLDALWTGVINDWESEDRHAKFLDHVARVHAFTEAARRYAAVKEDDARGEQARRRLAALSVLATQELLATRTPSPGKRAPGWIYAVTVAVCLGLLGWVALAWWGK